MSLWRRPSGAEADDTDPVAALEAAYEAGKSAEPALVELLRIAEHEADRLTAKDLQGLAACLVQELPGRYRRWVGLHRFHTALALYDRLLWALGEPCLPAMRWVVEQAAGESVGEDRHDRRGFEARAFVLPAIAVITEYGSDQDLDRLAAILAAEQADPLVRLAAGVAAVQRRGEPAVEVLLDAALAPAMPVNDVSVSTLAGGGWLVHSGLAQRLAHADEGVRDRAGALLSAMLRTAVPALVEFVRTTTSPVGLEAAADTLRQIEPGRLLDALRARDLSARGLSRAEAPGEAVERGLSRSEDA